MNAAPKSHPQRIDFAEGEIDPLSGFPTLNITNWYTSLSNKSCLSYIISLNLTKPYCSPCQRLKIDNSEPLTLYCLWY